MLRNRQTVINTLCNPQQPDTRLVKKAKRHKGTKTAIKFRYKYLFDFIKQSILNFRTEQLPKPTLQSSGQNNRGQIT